MRNEAPPGAVPGRYADGPGRRPGTAVWGEAVWDEPPTVPIQKAGGQPRSQAADLASGQAAGLATLVAIAEAEQSPGTHRLPGMRQPPGRPSRAAPRPSGRLRRGRKGESAGTHGGRPVRSRCGSGLLTGFSWRAGSSWRPGSRSSGSIPRGCPGTSARAPTWATWPCSPRSRW